MYGPMAPLVSVIIPTYNWSSVLPFSIGSVLRQTFTDFELLVIGDGCTDDSEAVVARARDPRVKWINLPANTGHQSAPNNEGLQQARGQFIAYLGHDDLWLSHHLSCLVASLQAGADLAYGISLLVVEPDGSDSRLEPLLDRYYPGMWIPPTNVVHRRSVTDRVGGWRHYRELDTYPDADLWLRAYNADYRWAAVPRLTAVKFPAAARRDVYKLRPCHEQAAWFKRIQNEDDFEMVELTKIHFVTARKAAAQAVAKSYWVLLDDFVRETRKRIMRRLLPMTYRVPSGSPSGKRGGWIDAGREFKGLERKP